MREGKGNGGFGRGGDFFAEFFLSIVTGVPPHTPPKGRAVRGPPGALDLKKYGVLAKAPSSRGGEAKF